MVSDWYNMVAFQSGFKVPCRTRDIVKDAEPTVKITISLLVIHLVHLVQEPLSYSLQIWGISIYQQNMTPKTVKEFIADMLMIVTRSFPFDCYQTPM